MAFTFTYLDPNDVEVSMSVPERSTNEMCEYFQRFLSACGYIFDEGEQIKAVGDKPNYLNYGGDYNSMNCFGGTKLYGSSSEDTICYGSHGNFDPISFYGDIFNCN